jgi:heme/copper-type cytochrome/quinol oxidase subunit 2
VLDPKGMIGLEERDLLFKAAGLMLIVIIPVFVMTFWFAWRFRASNANALYAPQWTCSLSLDALVWLAPATIVLVCEGRRQLHVVQLRADDPHRGAPFRTSWSKYARPGAGSRRS